jgi:hypothetical protein
VDPHRPDRPAGARSRPVFPVNAIDDPALPETLAELVAARADETDADTVNRELTIARKAIGSSRVEKQLAAASAAP